MLKIGVAVVVCTAAYFGMQSVLKGRAEKRKAMEEFTAARREVADDMKRDMDKNGGLSSDTAEHAMNKMRGQIDKMAAQGGKDGAAMKAVAELMAEIHAKATPYLAIIKRIETDNPMDMTTVKDKADLAARREFGKEMLRMNQDLITTFNSAESILRGKLQKAGAGGRSNEEFVEGFMKGYGKTSRIQIRIRKSDETIAKSLIAMTDLLETAWGKWKKEGGRIVFEEDAPIKRFNELVADTVKAADEQTAAQRELIDLQQKQIK